MKTKGQSLPLNAIVIAIIVLVVLVVLIAIFTGRIAVFDKKIGEQGNVGLAVLGADCLASFGATEGAGKCAQSDSCSDDKESTNWAGADVRKWCGPGLVCCTP